jgi:hypothetical protein
MLGHGYLDPHLNGVWVWAHDLGQGRGRRRRSWTSFGGSWRLRYGSRGGQEMSPGRRGSYLWPRNEHAVQGRRRRVGQRCPAVAVTEDERQTGERDGSCHRASGAGTDTTVPAHPSEHHSRSCCGFESGTSARQREVNGLGRNAETSSRLRRFESVNPSSQGLPFTKRKRGGPCGKFIRLLAVERQFVRGSLGHHSESSECSRAPLPLAMTVHRHVEGDLLQQSRGPILVQVRHLSRPEHRFLDAILDVGGVAALAPEECRQWPAMSFKSLPRRSRHAQPLS